MFFFSMDTLWVSTSMSYDGMNTGNGHIGGALSCSSVFGMGTLCVSTSMSYDGVDTWNRHNWWARSCPLVPDVSTVLPKCSS